MHCGVINTPCEVEEFACDLLEALLLAWGHQWSLIYFHHLISDTIGWRCEWGWSVLSFGRFGVLKLQKGSFDIVFHAGCQCSSVVVPIKVNSHIAVSCPICFYWVVIFQGLDKVFSVRKVFILYSEVIDNQGEADGSGSVKVKTGCVG